MGDASAAQPSHLADLAVAALEGEATMAVLDDYLAERGLALGQAERIGWALYEPGSGAWALRWRLGGEYLLLDIDNGPEAIPPALELLDRLLGADWPADTLERLPARMVTAGVHARRIATHYRKDPAALLRLVAAHLDG